MRHPAGAAVLVLVAVGAATAQGTGGLRGPLDAVVKAQAEAQRRFVAEYGGATTDEARGAATARYREEAGRHASEALDLARAHPADPATVEALRFAIETARGGPGDQAERAMQLLLRDHVRDPGMGPLCGKLFSFRHSPTAEALLRAVIERHPGRDDRGLACQSLAALLEYRAAMVREVRQGTQPVTRYVDEALREPTERLIRDAEPDALIRESDALRERIMAEYADVKDWFTPRRTLGAIAEGELFARRSLGEGQVAPEIRGVDHEGRPFALSDYRGKVVVLTFSASWCGPCVAMYPRERELARKLADRPFALLTVNGDDDLARLKRPIAAGEITWRCWWDGGMDGPITTRWGVVAIPAVFVIDRAGVIRRKDLRGDDLEAAVMALLDEAPAR